MSSAVALYIRGLVEMCEVEGVELHWTWIGKSGCSLLISETGFL